MVSHMRLLSGKPFKVGELTFYQPTINQVDDMGEEMYSNLYQSLLIDKNHLKDNPDFNQDFINSSSDFQIFMKLNLEDQMFREIIKHTLHLFTGEDFFYDGDYLKAIVSTEDSPIDVYLDEKLFFDLRSVVRQINYIPDKAEGAFKPANSKAEELKQRLEKAKQKVKEDNKENGLRLSDIVSIVSSYSNDLNIFNVWDLTIFQLFESYVRILVWDEYHIGQQHSPHMDENSRKELSKSHWVKQVSPNIFKEEK